MQEAAGRGHLYGDPEGWDLRDEIARLHQVSVENVCLGAGIDELLMLFVKAFVAPDDPVVTSFGGYPTFDYAVAGCGGQIERVEYREDMVDLEGLAQAAHRVKAKLVYLANPDNPSGSWHSAASVEEFASSLPSDSLLLLDEAYADFVPLAERPPMQPWDPHVVRFRTFSKAHGMAGLRIGYVLCAPEHTATLNKIRLHFGVNSVAQSGALTSLRDPSHVSEVVRLTNASREVLVAAAADLGIASLPSRTNFVCLDLEDRGRAELILKALLDRGVFVRKPMLPPLDRCIRVTIGPEAEMLAFLAELRESLAAA